MYFNEAGIEDKRSDDLTDFNYQLDWIHYTNCGVIDNNLKAWWQDIYLKETSSRETSWRIKITGSKQKYKKKKVSKDQKTNESSKRSPRMLQRGDINYLRRQIILSYYGPFLKSLKRIYKSLINYSAGKTTKDAVDKLILKEQSNWNVIIKYSINRTGPIISFRQIKENSCVREIKLSSLKKFKLEAKDPRHDVKIIDDIHPNIFLKVDPYAPIEQILTQIGEIVDDFNFKLRDSKIGKIHNLDFKKRLNSRSIKDLIARKEQNKKIYNKTNWKAEYGKDTLPQDLIILNMFNKNKSLSEIEHAIHKIYKKDSAPKMTRVSDRLKAICEYSEKHKRNKSSFYKKCKKMTNKGNLTLNDLKV